MTTRPSLPPQSSIFTAQVVLNASAKQLATTQYMLSKLNLKEKKHAECFLSFEYISVYAVQIVRAADCPVVVAQCRALAAQAGFLFLPHNIEHACL